MFLRVRNPDGQSATASFQVDGATDPHAYFRALQALPSHWKSYSLRDPAQLDYPQHGGYAHNKHASVGLWVTYDPASDADPQAQDAAKVVIPAYANISDLHVLAVDIDAQQTVLPILDSVVNPSFYQRTVRLDAEKVVVESVDTAGKTITVLRGQAGTTPTAHAAGTRCELSVNSLLNQVRLPLGTEDGHTYVIVWDAYWTDSYLRANTHSHKTFQLSSGGDSIWIEPRLRYEGGSQCCRAPGFNPDIHVAAVDVRSYQNPSTEPDWTKTNGHVRGPGHSGTQPIEPIKEHMLISPGRWVRFVAQVEQRANDYDPFTLWAMDEVSGPVCIYDHVLTSVRPGGLDKFWIEVNSSQVQPVRPDDRDWVMYMRNVVALRDPSSLDAVLVRPVG